MRKIERRPLPAAADRFLRRKQSELDAEGNGAHAATLWGKARKTVALRATLVVLGQMARERQRCMFCEDSHGTDIDHFWPKSKYPRRTFDWVNLLLVCARCNRAKGQSFPLDDRGEPLLIDPTAEDPWAFLFYDSVTGNLAPRYRPDGCPEPKGVTTIKSLPLRHETITEGRLRSQRQMKRAVAAFLAESTAAPHGKAKARLAEELHQAVRDSDDCGLGQWFFCKDGQQSEPFATLRRAHPTVWQELQQLVTR